jgi:hypothetical protein
MLYFNHLLKQSLPFFFLSNLFFFFTYSVAVFCAKTRYMYFARRVTPGFYLRVAQIAGSWRRKTHSISPARQPKGTGLSRLELEYKKQRATL